MSSYYTKRVKSRQRQDAKEARVTSRVYQKRNNRKTYRKSFGEALCSENYCPPTNNFGTVQSRTTATFLRLCKRGDETSIYLISTGKISKATIVRGFEIAIAFGHAELVVRFIEIGVADYFSFHPVKIYSSLEFSRIMSFALEQNNMRFCKWFASQAISQGFTKEIILGIFYGEKSETDLSILRTLLKCHPDPASMIDRENLLAVVFSFRHDVIEILLEFQPTVKQWLVDYAIEVAWISVLEMSLKTGKVEPKHSRFPLPRLVNLDMDRDDVIISPRELNVVRILLKFGANLDERDRGMNLLHSAAIQLGGDDRYGREVMDFMFEYMFEFDYTEKYGGKMVVDYLPVK